MAVLGNGTVVAWGSNSRGQLGDGTTSDRNVPAPVPGLDNVVAVAGGMFHSLALRADGTVWAWGANESGQLGDGTTQDRTTPVRVSSLAGVVQIATKTW
ncbi:MAG: RCC1 repeat-containing protein, partial [Fimbriimonadaceae bacterium]|nr:RCC1 repeat-containing protein [Fimbriimonadaceae bacterium]